MSGKNKTNKVSKGYRLKPETHNLIKKIQKLLQSTQEEVIGFACRKYYLGLKSDAKQKKQKINY